MEKSSIKYISMGIIFSIVTIVFAVLYYFKVITDLDLYLAVTYMSYFIGIALLYLGGYTRNQSKTFSTILNFLFAMIFIVLSIVLLIYGLASGRIVI